MDNGSRARARAFPSAVEPLNPETTSVQGLGFSQRPGLKGSGFKGSWFTGLRVEPKSDLGRAIFKALANAKLSSFF